MRAGALPRTLGVVMFALLLGVGLALPSSAALAGPDQVGATHLPPQHQEAGLVAGQAQQRLVEEASANEIIPALRAALGSSFAGAWFGSGSADLIIGITDPAKAQQVRAAGAVPQLVSLNWRTLDRLMTVLDSRASTVPDTVTGWYIDPASNSVVVSATDPMAATAFAAGMQGVRIKQVLTKPKLFADLRGGLGIQGNGGARCSTGFNATAGGLRYVITAGHCTVLGGIWSGESGGPIGPVAGSSFPGDDFGIIEVTSPSWTLTPEIFTNGGSLTVTGASSAPVGASVCRSGSSSGYRCGRIEALDQTVNYGGGAVVSGLTRTSICGEPGDSGGPYVSGSQAQGVLSGGSGSCFLPVLGAETFFQPIGEVLAAYGLTLLTG